MINKTPIWGLLFPAIFLVESCRPAEDSNDSTETGSEMNHDRRDDPSLPAKDSRFVSETFREESNRIHISHETDLSRLLETMNSSDLCGALNAAFYDADDRVELARSLIANYSGYPETRAAVELSSAMEQWPIDYVEAILAEVPARDHERLIGRHLSLHQASKNRSAINAVCNSLESGSLRNMALSRLCSLDYDNWGIDAALETISGLPFNPEKSATLAGLISTIATSNGTFTAREYEKIKEFSENIPNTANVVARMDLIMRLREGREKK